MKESLTVIDRHEQQIAALKSEIDQLCESISHDLASPVRAITGLMALVEEIFESGDSEEIRGMLRLVKNESARLGDMMEGLVTYSRLGRQHISVSSFDMLALGRERVELQLKEGSRVAVRFEDEGVPNVAGDLALLRIVWDQLIANAIKFSSGRADQTIELKASTDGREARFVVKDNGAGFDDRFAERLFRAFQRLHRAEEFPGVGLGLAMVQRIVVRHGGHVWAESSPGEGASFGFALPLERASEPDR